VLPLRRRALVCRPTPEERECLNLGSYNYLGFADDWHETCKPSVMAAAAAYPASMCTSFAEGGYTSLHRELERTVADFVGKPAAMVFNMGFATNSLGIPAFVGKGCLLISDSLNHSSIVTGARASGATVRVFAHNDADSLEALLRQSIVAGQERSHRPWRKIVVIVEGIYSMEGDLCNLRDIARVTKKYRAYLYMDEAHSIGAMGRTGRGMCEQAGVDPADVDVLMGTFTKSFGAMGGYIAGSAALIAALRAASAGFLSDNAMSPIVCQQVLTTFRVIRGDDGTGVGAAKIRRLKDNANYFRARLTELGCEIIGDADSPIIPLMLYNPTKIAAFSRECLDRGVRGQPGRLPLRGGAAPRRALTLPPPRPAPAPAPAPPSSPSSSSASPPRRCSSRARASACPPDTRPKTSTAPSRRSRRFAPCCACGTRRRPSADWRRVEERM
jgi:serine palmitoyltransferase